MNHPSTINATFHARWTDDRTKPQPLSVHLQNVSQRAETLANLAR
jgi:hypothetical protein